MFIFYNRNHWGKIIAKCLQPKIISLTNELNSFSVYFSQDRGDHIKVNLEYGIGDHNDGWTKFQEDILEYINKNPSPNEKVKFWLDRKMFMDYPNNKTKSNVLELQKYGDTRMEFDYMRQAISVAIMSAVSLESADLEDLISFLMYSQFLALKAIAPSLNEAESNSKKILSYIERMQQSACEKAINTPIVDAMFVNNRKILHEIILDIWNGGVPGIGIAWCPMWEEACKRFISESNHSSTESFVNICTMLVEHTGLRVSPYQFSSGLLLHSFCHSQD